MKWPVCRFCGCNTKTNYDNEYTKYPGGFCQYDLQMYSYMGDYGLEYICGLCLGMIQDANNNAYFAIAGEEE